MRKSLTILLLALTVSITARGAGTNAPATNAPSASASTNAAAVPLADIAAQSESASAALQTIAFDVSSDKTTESVQQDLPVITDEISARLEENSHILSRSPSLELVRRLAGEWQEIRDELGDWKHELTHRAGQMDGDITRLSLLEKTWDLTRESTNKVTMPPEVLQKIDGIISDIKDTRGKVEAQQALLLTLQNRVAEQDIKISQSLAAIDHARQDIVGHLLVRDSPPIWSSELRAGQKLAQESQHSFSRQYRALAAYTRRKPERFILHGAIFLVVLGLILWARRRLRRQGQEDSELKHAILVFEIPIATALVLSLVASSWIYPQAPRLLWAILGAAALVPAVIVLRRLVGRPLFPVLNILVAFYFVDQLRSVAAAPELLSRSLFLLEMLTGIAFLIWFLRCRFSTVPIHSLRWRKLFTAAMMLATILFVAAFCANVLGFGVFSKLLGSATLTCAYLGLILYAVIRIADGLILSVLTIRPLGALTLVQRHRRVLQARVRQLLEWAAIALWLLYALEAVALRAPLFQDLKEILVAKLTLGSATFSLGDLLLFVVTVWVAFMVSRITRFILEEEVYPHIQLAPGLHYSISRMVHYAILLAGFLIGIALLGFNLTRLTILAGAVGVGLGFGLQNIINNFVSGIILLFERPVKVGDVIEIGSTEGVVMHIGIRASIVRTTNGPEIIVPNGKLISDPVTNWTFSRRQRLITIPVSVVPGVEAARILQILKDASAAHSAITRDPPAQCLFVSFAGGALNFELRVWTNQINDWMQIRSDLSAAINSALVAQNISIK